MNLSDATSDHGNRQQRHGFTLIETLVAVVLLSGVVLAMAMGTTLASRRVSNSNGASRAQAVADLQIARARVWPSYATLTDLAGTVYNVAVDGMKPTTTVVVDSLNNLYQTRITVTVTGSATSGLTIPIRRSITIAAP